MRQRLNGPAQRLVLDLVLRRAQRGLVFRENAKNEMVRILAHLRTVASELGGRLAGDGVLRSADDVFFLDLDELRRLVAGASSETARVLIMQRRSEFERNQKLTPPAVVTGRGEALVAASAAAVLDGDRLIGVGVSPGLVTGTARVILRANTDERVLPGEVLVAPFTDPGWTPYFQLAAALVTDLGGLLSHGSIIAREYGLPAVVNVAHATRLIRTGDRIEVDGTRGEVRILRSE
jgi:pyruvate,water dikinase